MNRAAERYRLILETAPDAIVVIDRSGTIVYANAQTEKLFGHPSDAIVGAALDVLLPTHLRGAHGRHIESFFEHPTPRPMGSGIELFGLRVDGQQIPIEVSLSPVETDGHLLVSAAIRDITERKRIEDAARLHAERLAGAVESIQGAIAIYDAKDELVVCNQAFQSIVAHRDGASLVGRSYADVLDGWLDDVDFADAAARARYRDERLAERSAPEGTSDVRTKGGKSLRITSRRTADGGIVQTVWDLSGDVQREQELREARTAAEAGSAAKSEFLSSMSHELRTPLNAILGFAQLLQRDRREPLSTRHAGRVDQILRGGEHLLRLIDDILDLSGIEAGRVSISPEPVDVAVVLETVRSTLEPSAIRQGIRLAVEPVDAALPMVAVDRTRFAQILMNLGSNAIKYNRAGGVVTFAVSRLESGPVRIAVTDTGVGIPLEHRAKLFQPFHRAGQETGPIEGTGIGLTISRSLAALMNAEVGYTSEVDVGSTFWLDVPIDAGLARKERSAGHRDPTLAHGAQQKTVLYVEDNPANIAFMEDLLSAFPGIEFLAAPTAEIGIEIALARRPAAILMDINLPGVSGLDALRVLRAYPATAHIPIIALTAAASEKERDRGIAAGFFRYITKPVKVDELLSALEAILSS